MEIDDFKNIENDKELFGLAHELWANAQLLPSEGISDGVDRIFDTLKKAKILIDTPKN